MTSRILVVDDSPTLRKVVGAILERHGYEVLKAADGQLAFELLTGEAPPGAPPLPETDPPRGSPPKVDLVLLDFVMPNMNGFQFCRAVRQKEGLAMLPVVLMSAKSDKIRDQFVTQTGAIDAISKPFDAQALVAVIENALRRVETGRASAARLPHIDDDDGEFDSSITTSPGGDMLKRAKITADIGAKLGNALGPALVALPPGAHTLEHLGNLFTTRLSDELLRDMGVSLREIEIEDASRSALSGDLAIIPIGAVMQMLQVEGQSGVLTVWSGVSEIALTMRGGLIDLVQSRLAGDEFRLGRYFVEEALVTPQEIEALLARDPQSTPPKTAPPASGAFVASPSRESEPETKRFDSGPPPALTSPEALFSHSPHSESLALPPPPSSLFNLEAAQLEAAQFPPASTSEPPVASVRASQPVITNPLGLPASRLLGDVLVAAGRITDEQLRVALVRQSSELVYEMLRWQRGRFDFKRRPATPLAQSAKLGLTVPAVVMEGFRRVDEWRALEVTLGNFESVLVTDPTMVASIGQGTLPRIEQVVLDAVDGERTVREVIAETHMSSFDACRILVQLMEARLVRRRNSP